MQEFTSAEKRQLRAEKFEREAERTTNEQSATLATVQRDTALAWLDRYFAEAMAAVVVEQTRAARLEIEAAATAYRGGRVIRRRYLPPAQLLYRWRIAQARPNAAFAQQQSR
jgi:hypothetical protein